MRKLFRRREGQGRARTFIRMLTVAAMALGSALMPTHEKEICMHPISYEVAKACPERRQEYLDSKAPAWRGECIAELIYDPDGKKEPERTLMDLRRHGLKPEPPDPEQLPACIGVTAYVHMDERLVGRGERADVFFCDTAFKFSYEAELGMTIMLHEAVHACDKRHGMKVGERLFTHKELADVPQAVRRAVGEVRAYGRNVRKFGRMLSGEVLGLDFYASMLLAEENGLGNAADWYDAVEKKKMKLLEDALSKVDGEGTPTQYLIRHTLHEYREELRRFMEKEEIMAATSFQHWRLVRMERGE